jgi:2'-5' RNA ligase
MVMDQNKRSRIAEYTVVAFLSRKDSDTFQTAVHDFPRSTVEQLPPHLTILNKIFSDVPTESLTKKVEDALGLYECGPLVVRSNGFNVWNNLKYQGYSLAVGIDSTQELIKLRLQLEHSLKSVTIPEEESLWSEYMPHITISLSVNSVNAAAAKLQLVPPPMSFGLQTLDLLLHGGDFFGYSKVSRFRIPTLTGVSSGSSDS